MADAQTPPEYRPDALIAEAEALEGVRTVTALSF